MDLSFPERHTFVTSRGYKYSYIHAPCQLDKPMLLLIHGWPSHADDWIYQIRYFSSKGYGLIVPDMLGYGESSNPREVNVYHLKLISQDLAELLDHCRIERVVGVGHDWGATILSRFALYYSQRLTAAAFLGIGAPKPGTSFDLDGINEMTKRGTGSEMLGYITYIARDPKAQIMMEQNAGSVMDLMFTADRDAWNRHFHPQDGFKTFVELGHRQKVGRWFPEDLRRSHLRCFGSKGGYLGSLRYYMMQDQNISVPDEEANANFIMQQPTLLVIPRIPAVSSQMQAETLSAWTSKLTVVHVDSGHWVHLERSQETNRAIEQLVDSCLGSQPC